MIASLTATLKAAFLLFAFTLLNLLVVAPAAEGGQLIGSEFAGDVFFDIDPTDGSASVLPITTTQASGLAYNPDTNSLYVMVNGSLEVVSLDDNTSVSLPNDDPSSLFLTGLAFSPDRSTLYALGLGSPQGTGIGIFSIDPTNGDSTFLAAASSLCCGIAVRSDGLIVTSDLNGNLRSHDPNNGFTETLLGSVLGLSDTVGVTALTFDENDVLFGIATQPDSLITIDVDQLTFTTIGGDIGSDVRGLTFIPEPVSLVLALGTLVMLPAVRRCR